MYSFFRPLIIISLFLFFFTDPPTTEIYTLSLHDALPILSDNDDLPFNRDFPLQPGVVDDIRPGVRRILCNNPSPFTFTDRKSTRLNSSHQIISYAVFCLKKKKKTKKNLNINHTLLLNRQI